MTNKNQNPSSIKPEDYQKLLRFLVWIELLQFFNECYEEKVARATFSFESEDGQMVVSNIEAFDKEGKEVDFEDASLFATHYKNLKHGLILSSGVTEWNRDERF